MVIVLPVNMVDEDDVSSVVVSDFIDSSFLCFAFFDHCVYILFCNSPFELSVDSVGF